MKKKIASNMTEVYSEDGTRFLVSYSTPVAAFIPEIGYLRTNEWFSQTTSKHINKWLRMNEALGTESGASQAGIWELFNRQEKNQ